MKGSSKSHTCRLPLILRTKQMKMHQNYKRLQQKKRNETGENVSGSWDPTTFDCKFIKNEISRLARVKMAEGCISSIHSRKKRATDLHGWKYKNHFVKVNCSLSRQGELHVKMNPSNASISAAHLRINIIEPLQRKKLRLNTPGEFRLPSTCYACILSSFICSSVQRVVRTALHETTHELLGLDADPDESLENSYAAVRAIYTRDDFNTARSSHKTFVESADGASRYAPHSFWVTKWTVARISSSLPLHLCGNTLQGVRSTPDGRSCCIAMLRH
jgi:hypothetical protein